MLYSKTREIITGDGTRVKQAPRVMKGKDTQLKQTPRIVRDERTHVKQAPQTPHRKHDPLSPRCNKIHLFWPTIRAVFNCLRNSQNSTKTLYTLHFLG